MEKVSLEAFEAGTTSNSVSFLEAKGTKAKPSGEEEMEGQAGELVPGAVTAETNS